MEYLGLFNFTYLILFFIWENLINNPYRKDYNLNDKSYNRQNGTWDGCWTEFKIDKHGISEEDVINDFEIRDKLNFYEQFGISRSTNRSQIGLMFLTFVNFCFIGEGTWIEQLLQF